jgi:AraC-like DNA-binding protein/TolB-like protein
LKKATEWLEAEPGRPWRLSELAAACGVAPRTLQKHFRRFLGRAPLAFLRELRFERARQELLAGCEPRNITEIATRCGFGHLGRFAIEYRQRYGESPSATRRRSWRAGIHFRAALPILTSTLERPTIAVLPFESVGAQPVRATSFADEIALALWRLHWIRVAAPPHARYQLRGKVREDGRRLRVTVRLFDALTGRYLWAANWDGNRGDLIEFEERIAIKVARATSPALRAAEVDRASSLDRGHWPHERRDSMRGTPCQRRCWQPATHSPMILQQPPFMPSGRLRSTAARHGLGGAAAGSRPIAAALWKRSRSSRSRGRLLRLIH